MYMSSSSQGAESLFSTHFATIFRRSMLQEQASKTHLRAATLLSAVQHNQTMTVTIRDISIALKLSSCPC